MLVNEFELNRVANFIENELKKELVTQGHKASKKLLNSIQVEFKKNPEPRIEGRFLEYGVQLDTGQPKGTIVPIKDLLKWFRYTRINAKGFQAVRVARNIQNAIRRQGSPTRGSYKFSKNGRRTGWVSHTLKVNQPKIAESIRAAAKKQIEIIIVNIARQTKTFIR